MDEIGGYFQLENLYRHEYYSNLIALNTARNAISYLHRTRDIHKLWLPFFLCDSVSGICKRDGIQCGFYRINPDFTPAFNSKLEKHEFIYIVNFYGQLTSEQIIQYKTKYDRVILDNVQAFFDNPIPGIDTIYSCRKFFGVPDGAYLSTDAKKIELETDVSKERMYHLLGRFEGTNASEYYSYFVENDNLFRELPLRFMSLLTKNFMGAIEYEKVIEKRNSNWAFLHSKLGQCNFLNLRQPNGPYMYPLYCKKGLEIKKLMSKQGIYIPTLWPNVLELRERYLEKDYAENILPLPIDQRYDCIFLSRVVNELKSVIEL